MLECVCFVDACPTLVLYIFSIIQLEYNQEDESGKERTAGSVGRE